MLGWTKNAGHAGRYELYIYIERESERKRDEEENFIKKGYIHI